MGVMGLMKLSSLIRHIGPIRPMKCAQADKELKPGSTKRLGRVERPSLHCASAGRYFLAAFLTSNALAKAASLKTSSA